LGASKEIVRRSAAYISKLNWLRIRLSTPCES